MPMTENTRTKTNMDTSESSDGSTKRTLMASVAYTMLFSEETIKWPSY